MWVAVKDIDEYFWIDFILKRYKSEEILNKGPVAQLVRAVHS